jgi:hypothetical protein
VLLQGPVHAAAVLLVVAGAQKVLDPLPLVRATRSVGLRVPRTAVRCAATVELAVGLAALLDGSRLSALAVAVSYAAFTGFVLLARARGGVLASCGCFGTADTPPTVLHAVVTGGLAAAAATGAPGPVPLGAAALVTTAAVAVTVYAVLAVLPTVRAA